MASKNKIGKFTNVKRNSVTKITQFDPVLMKDKSSSIITYMSNRKSRQQTTKLPPKGNPEVKSNSTPVMPKMPAPSLIGLINTHSANGKLIYLWPYGEWIKAVMNEYTSTPKPLLPCSTKSSGEENYTIHIESYYDYSNTVSNRKINVQCNRAALVSDIPAISSYIAFIITIHAAVFVF